MTIIKKVVPCYYCGEKQTSKQLKKDGKEGTATVKQDYWPLMVKNGDNPEMREVCFNCYEEIPKQAFETQFMIEMEKLNKYLKK